MIVMEEREITSNEKSVHVWQNFTDRRIRNKAMKAILKRNKGLTTTIARKTIGGLDNFDDTQQELAIRAMRDLGEFDLKTGHKFLTSFAQKAKSCIALVNHTAEIIRPRYKKKLKPSDPTPEGGFGRFEARHEWVRTPHKSIHALNHQGYSIEDSLSTTEKDKSEAHKFTDELTKILEPTEKKVIEMYFGIDTTPHNNQEIGYVIRKTRERVRQIKEKALGKMREHAKQRKMAGDTLFTEVFLNL